MRQIVITISETYLDRLGVVAKELRREGLVITRVYAFGVITGMAEEEDLPRIRNRKEVASLADGKRVDIPPPDSDIQ